MICSCCDFERAAERQFTSAKTTRELQAYRRGRIGATTRALRDAVVDAGLKLGRPNRATNRPRQVLRQAPWWVSLKSDRCSRWRDPGEAGPRLAVQSKQVGDEN